MASYVHMHVFTQAIVETEKRQQTIKQEINNKDGRKHKNRKTEN